MNEPTDELRVSIPLEKYNALLRKELFSNSIQGLFNNYNSEATPQEIASVFKYIIGKKIKIVNEHTAH